MLCTAPVCHWDWEWANWKVSGTQRFTRTASIVVDELTGLVWQGSVSSTQLDWPSAKGHCADLMVADGGWRLPTRIELLTIRDPNRGHPAIDPAAFPNTPADIFWTSTPNSNGPLTAWRVSFVLGEPFWDLKTNTHWVRCVRER
jgi:hypothetical protein